MDMLSYNKSLKQISRNLRRNMTDAEMLLWSKLRVKQIKSPLTPLCQRGEIEKIDPLDYAKTQNNNILTVSK
ncbi:MAG: hypothetical protein A2Z47_07565 [Thermodesulfovibrio sp. RBG_19FT_COMBO_42_12]|nr:MAG: hypothetical protein A2Z47_07565 [Thermodesulfovibrio sp. RBG_19FT_COMBO_42_12]